MTAVSISSGSSLSGVVDLTVYNDTGRLRASGLFVPASWATASISFLFSIDQGLTYNPLYTSGGSLYTLSGIANTYVPLDLGIFAGIDHFKIQSGTPTAPVNQGANCNFIINTVIPDFAGLGSNSSGGGGGSTAVTTTYNTTPPSSTNGQTQVLQGDVQGDLKVYIASLGAGEDLSNNTQGVTLQGVIGTAYSRKRYWNGGANATGVVKSSMAQIVSCFIQNFSGNQCYLQFFNSNTAPSTGNTPDFALAVPATGTGTPGYASFGDETTGENGFNLPNGLSYGISSTLSTYTATGTGSNFNIVMGYF